MRGGGEELRPCLIAGEGGGAVGSRRRGAGGREAGKERLGGDAGEEVEGAGRWGMAAAAEGCTDGGRRNPGSFPATGHGRSGGRRRK